MTTNSGNSIWRHRGISFVAALALAAVAVGPSTAADAEQGAATASQSTEPVTLEEATTVLESYLKQMGKPVPRESHGQEYDVSPKRRCEISGDYQDAESRASRAAAACSSKSPSPAPVRVRLIIGKNWSERR